MQELYRLQRKSIFKRFRSPGMGDKQLYSPS